MAVGEGKKNDLCQIKKFKKCVTYVILLMTILV